MADGDLKDEDWDLVEESQSRRHCEERKRLHQQKCDAELEQATKMGYILIEAQGDVSSGKLRCHEGQVDEVHRRFCIPGTSVKIRALQLDGENVVITQTKHSFKTGQNAIITGLKVLEDAPSSVREVVQKLSRDHVVVYVDECRFSLHSVPILCSWAPNHIDLTDAEVALNVSCWADGRTSVPHSLLLASSTALSWGLGPAVSKAFHGLRVSCTGLQSVADASARHVGHTHRMMPPGTLKDSFAGFHWLLSSLSDFEGPDVQAKLTKVWERTVEAVQPQRWKSASAADLCEECQRPFWTAHDGHGRRCDTVLTLDASKHHCRNCGRVVCDECSKDRKCVPWEGHSQAVRVCKVCVPVVDMKNLTLQQFYALNQQVRLATAGLYQSKPKGRGKGPPMPPVRKGKGKGQDSAQRGLGVLSQDIKPQIGEVKDFVMVQSHVLDIKATRGPTPKNLQKTVQQNSEELALTVAMNGCKHHFNEIGNCLKCVTLEGALELESWFGKVDQIMPLESKFSRETLSRLKAVPEKEFSKLNEYERAFRQHFLAPHLLPVESLFDRWCLLRLLHEMDNYQELYWKPLDAAQRSIEAMLPPSSAASSAEWSQLRPEVKNMVAVLNELMEPKCETLPDLVQRTKVGAGPQLFSKAWNAGQTHSLCNVKGFLELLSPALKDVVPLQTDEEKKPGHLEVALEKFLKNQRNLQNIHDKYHEQSDDETLMMREVLAPAFKKLEGVFDNVERGLRDTLEKGRSLLLALGQPVQNLSSPGANVILARNVDLHLQSLRSLVDGLKEAEPRSAPRGQCRLRGKVVETSQMEPGKRKIRRRTLRAAQSKASVLEQREEGPVASAVDSESDDTHEEDNTGAASGTGTV